MKHRKFLVMVVAATLLPTTVVADRVQAETASADVDVVAAVEMVEQVLGSQTAVGVVGHDVDSVVALVEDGVTIDVPVDPSDGIAVDPQAGTAAVFTPTDVALGDFVADGVLAVAAGDGYAAVAQPLEDGDFRLAVVLDDATAPTSLSYQVELDPGVQPVQRLDGGYDFVDAAGAVVGGIGAPWAVDAAGNLVPVGYSFNGTTLTRTLYTNDTTVYPVTTNFCLFGKNPDGSCRNPVRPVVNAVETAYDRTLGNPNSRTNAVLCVFGVMRNSVGVSRCAGHIQQSNEQWV